MLRQEWSNFSNYEGVLFETVSGVSRYNKRVLSLVKEKKAINLDQMESIRLTGLPPELTYERLVSPCFIQKSLA